VVIKGKLKYGIWGIALLYLSACTASTEEQAVAQVGDKILYQSDIADILPNNSGKEDSILLVNDYINKWVKQELLIQKADENLSPQQKDVHKELEAYRNSLIIYKYKNELIKQRMDTVVSTSEIEEYYDSHSKDFNLNRCIVKAIFVKIPSDLANPALVKDLVSDTSDDGLAELREYCGQYAKKVDISVENWIDFQVLRNNLPLEVDDPQKFLRENSLKEMNDSNYYYIVSIHDYKLINDLAPIEFVENNIKNLILNQRKIKFLKEIEENIYTEGIRKNKFKIYNKKTNED
jgi:hypothetical protein